MKKKHLLKLQELLPASITEDTVKKIFTIVQKTIEEEDAKRAAEDAAKVAAFIRMNIDTLKEQALKELHETDEVSRKLQAYDDIMSFAAVELTSQDTENTLTTIATEAKNLDEGVALLSEELTKVIQENSKYETVIETLNSRVEELEAKLESSLNENKELASKVKKPYKSDEKARMILDNKELDLVSKGVSLDVSKKENTFDNEFLTEDVLKFAKD